MQLMNCLAEYRETGRKAGRAMKRGDAGLYRFKRAMFQAMRNAEMREYRGRVTMEYEAGYREGAQP